MEKKETGSTGVKAIAKLANVSIGTVDRVLNNRGGVAENTREKILKIIEELDYRPNLSARRLASRKKLKFAVLIPETSAETQYWADPLNGILQAASEIRDFGVEVSYYLFDQNDRTSFSEKADEISGATFDGVLMAPMFEEESLLFFSKCHLKKIPVVFINSDLPDQKNLCYIGPDLYQSGYLAAHIVNYLSGEPQNILVINISKEIDHHHHLLRKEEGFRKYFESQNRHILDKIDITQTDYAHISQKLSSVLCERKYHLLFVTNSRVSAVARYIAENRIDGIRLIGYDFLEENIEYLKNRVIDFLICQKPREQGYRGLMSLYHHLVLNVPVEKEQYMPIDIVTRENYQYYNN